MSDLPTAKTGDKLKNALTALSDAVKAHPDKNRATLLNEIEIRFDLSPRECEFLNDHFSSDQS